MAARLRIVLYSLARQTFNGTMHPVPEMSSTYAKSSKLSNDMVCSCVFYNNDEQKTRTSSVLSYFIIIFPGMYKAALPVCIVKLKIR